MIICIQLIYSNFYCLLQKNIFNLLVYLIPDILNKTDIIVFSDFKKNAHNNLAVIHFLSNT